MTLVMAVMGPSGLCSPCSLDRKRTLHLLERHLDINSAEPPQQQQEAAASNGPSKAASSSNSSKKRGQLTVDPVVSRGLLGCGKGKEGS